MNVVVEPRSDSSRRHASLEIFALLVAVSAFGGAVGLIGGSLSVGTELNARLPFHSPVLGGIALATIVGFPFSVVAWRAQRRDRRTGMTSVVAGVALVGWLVVELAFIREFSFFQVIYAVIGVAFAAVGRKQRGSGSVE